MEVYDIRDMENESSSCSNLSKHQESVIRWVVLGGGSLSFICCLLILLTVAIFKKVRTTSQRLFLYLVLVILAYSVVYVLHGVENRGALEGSDGFCMTTAFLDQLLSWMEVLAMLCLTFDMFIKIRTMDFRASKKYEKFYIVVIFVLPLVFNWIPFTTDSYGESGPYCWIRRHNTTCENDKYGIAYQFALFWIPFYSFIISIVVIYIWAMCKARVWIKYQSTFDPQSQSTKRQLVSELWQYMLYPLIVVFVNIIPLISRLATAITNKPLYEFQIAHGVCVNLEGPGLALVFFINSETRKDLGNYRKVKDALFEFFCFWKQPRVEPYAMIIDKDSDSLRKSDSYGNSQLKKSPPNYSSTATRATEKSLTHEEATKFSS